MSRLALVADDHPGSLELARYLLERGGFEVVSAKDGAQALKLAAELHPDVVVLDLDLAEINGCEVRDRLLADPELAHIPIVAMTVFEVSDRWPGRSRADFAGYIQKPIEPATFAGDIRAILESHPSR